jgi:zinc transport system ATP-binding protein
MARSRHNDETHFSHNGPSPSSFDSANLVIQMQLRQPNVILFDEPTASLDELEEKRIYELLHRLKEETGITVVVVSHDLSVVYRSATMVRCIGKGKPCFGPPKDVLTPDGLLARL